MYRNVLENNIDLNEEPFISDADEAINKLVSEKNVALFGNPQNIRKNKKVCKVPEYLCAIIIEIHDIFLPSLKKYGVEMMGTCQWLFQKTFPTTKS